MFQRLGFIAQACGTALIGLALGASAPAVARQAQDPPPKPDVVVGNWATEDGNGVISIQPCGNALCGRIVGIVRAPGKPIPKDVHGASQCGLTIITNERPKPDGSWIGEVTDPRDGSTYNAQLWLDNSGNLRLRGYVGLPLLGQTQTWRPFTGRVTPSCELA